MLLRKILLALRLLWRDVRAHEWTIIMTALMLSIAALTCVDFYIARVTSGIEQQGARLLGGDLVISSPSPIKSEWRQNAAKLHLHAAEVWSYPTMLQTANKLQLVTIQAVSANYPLLQAVPLALANDTVWIEARLFSALSLNINSAIKIGFAQFKVAKAIPSELEAINSGALIAPTLIMRLADVDKTKTVLPGSRVDYRLLLTGDKTNLKKYKMYIANELKPGQRIIDINNQQFILADNIKRASHFLQLVLLVCIVLSGVAIALSITDYMHRHINDIALYRVLGAKQRQLQEILSIGLLTIGVGAGLLGILVGAGLQAIIANVLQPIIPISLAAISLHQVWFSMAICLLLLLLFSLPLLTVLTSVPLMVLWRENIPLQQIKKSVWCIACLLVGTILVLLFNKTFAVQTLFYISILTISTSFLYLLAQLLISGANLLSLRTQGVLRRGLSQIVQYRAANSISFTGFTLILAALIFLSFTKNNIIQTWQASLPKATPNYFAINIAATDIDTFKAILTRNQVSLSGIYPMLRGRLMALNAMPIMSAIPASAKNHNALHRELNLSWMDTFPKDNRIIKGDAWPPRLSKQPFISIESELASTLHLKIGDRLTFQVGDKALSGIIYNIREVKWNSFHPNFYVIFAPGTISDFATTYITSFYLSIAQQPVVTQLASALPNATIIDVANILVQVREVVMQIASALQYLFWLMVLIGILIFIAAIKASFNERKASYQILHLLGASKKYLLQSSMVEFSIFFAIVISVAFTLAKALSLILLAYI